MPKLEFRSSMKPSMYAYPAPLEKEKEKFKEKVSGRNILLLPVHVRMCYGYSRLAIIHVRVVVALLGMEDQISVVSSRLLCVVLPCAYSVTYACSEDRYTHAHTSGDPHFISNCLHTN